MSMRFFLACVLVALPAAAADESASAIAQKARDRGGLNLLDLQADVKLTTVAKDGTRKEELLTSAARKVEGRTRSILRFSAPASVAGVAVLTVEGQGGDASDMSLYLPKLKLVRKVAKQERGKAFMDTDFNYADLGGTGGNDDQMKRLADDKVDGRDAYVLNGPAGADSPYGEVTLFVDKETYVPLRVEYKDKDGKAFKTYRTLKLKKFKDRTLAAQSEMENLQSGSKTSLEVQRIVDSSMGDEAFSERALERG
jgi:hypothetical protein